MKALDLLSNRVSCANLAEPAPTREQLDLMYQAAGRAPDHRGLKPFRFIEVAGERRSALGQVFVESSLAEGVSLDDARQKKLLNAPLRAPLVLVAVAVKQDDDKVPHSEQVQTAACATHSILLSAFAQGLGGIWRTGDIAFNPGVANALNVAEHEEIIGFLYLGTPKSNRIAPAFDTSTCVTQW